MVAAVGPFGLGPMELVVILLVLVLLFGATRIADIGSGLGKGIREFKKNVKEEDAQEPEPTQQAPAAVSPPAPPTNGVETISAVKCPSCGALNPADARHCNQCGSAIATPVS